MDAVTLQKMYREGLIPPILENGYDRIKGGCFEWDLHDQCRWINRINILIVLVMFGTLVLVNHNKPFIFRTVENLALSSGAILAFLISTRLVLGMKHEFWKRLEELAKALEMSVSSMMRCSGLSSLANERLTYAAAMELYAKNEFGVDSAPTNHFHTEFWRARRACRQFNLGWETADQHYDDAVLVTLLPEDISRIKSMGKEDMEIPGFDIGKPEVP